MKNYKIVVIAMLLFIGISLNANTEAAKKHILFGFVVDATNGDPLEYATVKLLSKNDSALITGTVSNLNGEFLLETKLDGEFLLQVNYLGYRKSIQVIEIKKAFRNIDLGTIRLDPAAENLSEVTVVANENAVDYKIDKKVLHVSQQYTAASGSAVDVLQNAPAVQVDVEGNVALRGNSSFTVLIDGRPTVLESTEALEQIPAAMIQDIEIITNPSAKYDPEGTAGIINIITKKRSLEGVNGIVNANIGLDDKYGADVLLNLRTENFNYFIAADYNNRNYPGTMEEETEFYSDPLLFRTADGDRLRGRERYSMRGGIEWFPNEKNTFVLSGRMGHRSHEWKTETEFNEWTSADPTIIRSYSIEDGGRGGYFYSLSGDYVHQFSGPKHKFDANFMLYNRDGDDETLNTLEDVLGNIIDGQISGEYGPSSGFRYRANYMQPFSKLVNIEAGLQGRYRNSQETNKVYYYNSTSEEYEFQDAFSNDVQYLQNIHAAYALSSGEWNNFGYQLGFRAEYTLREIKLNNTGETFDIDRMDFFPTTHLSYNLNENNQFMASYSRRIDRPRGWFLEPFVTWEDAFNVRSGNPDLKPEYIDAYEVGYQLNFGKHALTTELYYRKKKNNIERVRDIWPGSDDIILATFANVGNDHSLGTEIMLNLKLAKWWASDVSGNFFDYRVEGEYNGESFDKNSFTYNVRWNNTFTPFENTRIQINPAYYGPEVEPQDEEKPYFRVDGAVRQSFLQKKLQVTLQVRDIFATAKWESTTETNAFYKHRLYKYRAPIVMLNLTWRINNYKSKRGEGEMMNGGGMGEE